MPALAKTSTAEVIAAARKLIAKHGVESLSMQAVADAVGVSAPSLYKRFADRSDLVSAVFEELLVGLAERQRAVANTGSPEGDLRAMAHALRAYAHRQPHLYALLVSGRLPSTPVAAARNAAVVAPLLDRVQRLGEVTHALDGARLLTAFTHGFVSMELAGAFRLGGDTDRAFAFGLDRVLASLTNKPAKARRR
ncbi:MAG: TetR/AcrR family transcriptional regulator [Myxococcaceae bacterium]